MNESTKVEQVVAVLRDGLIATKTTEDLRSLFNRGLDLLSGASDVRYGCHCDLDAGQTPDECVIGIRPQDCIYAEKLVKENKSQWSCQYWKPIQPDTPGVEE